MSHYPLVKFVDSPAVAATVRLDLNDGSAAAPRRIEADIDLGAAPVEGDPEAVGQVFGFRTLNFTVQVKGTKANALAFVSALSKELARRTNWLMFQLDASRSPVWFKTYRTGYQPLSLEQVYANSATGGSASAGYPDVWRVQVPLVAEAFAYGARQTLSAIQIEQTIPADLDASWNAMTAVLPALKGDAPTALRVTVAEPAGVVSNTPNEWMIGCISGSTSMPEPAFNIGGVDGFTPDVGTSATASNAAYLSGDYRTITVSPNDGGAGSSIARRLFPSSTLTATIQGRCKVMLRYEADTTTGVKTYVFRLKMPVLGTVLSDAVSVPVGNVGGGAQTQQGWVDLGDFTYPFGPDLPADASGVSIPTGIDFQLYVGTSDNTSGTVRVDAIKFIPVGGPTVSRATLAKSTFRNVVFDASQKANGDGDTETAWTVNNTGVLIPAGAPEINGGYPIADPAADRNLLVVMATKQPGAGAAHVTGRPTSRKAQTTVTVSYFPRYAYIGDGT